MIDKMYCCLVILLCALVFCTKAFSQQPDLAKLASNEEKIKAWINYCEQLRLNNSGSKDNYVVLKQAALKGLTMAKAGDADSRSQFFFYTALGYYYQLAFDSAQFYFYESLHTAQEGHVAQRITRACVALIPVNFQLQQKDKVEECKNILQSITDTTKNESILQDGYYALGSYYQQKSYYSTAQDYFIKSLQLREKQVDTTADLKKKFDYAIQCDMLSKLYLNTQMADKSINTLRQAERFANVSPNVNNRLLSSFVEAYTTSGNIDSALYYNRKLEEGTKNSRVFTSETVSANLNLAIYYIDHKQYAKALPFLQKGDTIATQIQSPYMIFQAQMIKGKFLEETGKYDQAISLLLQSLPVAKQFSRELYSNILKLLALAQKGKGNAGAALPYYEQYTEQSDSISKEKLSANFADQETRYETKQKEERIASLGKENRLHVLELQNASRTRLLLIIGLTASGIISLLLYFIYRNKEKLNQVLNERNNQLDELNGQLAIANDTKAKLFGIIGHDLRSPVSQIVQLLQLQKEKPALLNEPSGKNHEEKIKAASENVLETMEDLLLWSKSQMQQFTPQFRKVLIADVVLKESALVQQQAEDKNISIKNEVPPAFTQKTDENFLEVIVRNLLQNAVKYSHAASVISISCDNNHLYISNQVAEGNAEILNALLQNKKVSSKSSGLGLQIANDLAVAIGVKILFTKTGDQRLTAIISWAN